MNEELYQAEGSSAQAQPAQEQVPGYPPHPTPPVITGTTNQNEIDQTQAAYQWAYQAVVRSCQALAKSPVPPAVVTWFGSDPTYYPKAAKVFNDMAASMSAVEPVKFTTSDPAQECTTLRGFRYAYWDPSTQQICLCWWFFLFFVSSGQQAEVVVHEVAHSVANLPQEEYDMEECRRLAADNPAQAIQNADNYGYFAMEIYPEKPSSNGIWADDSKWPSNSSALTPTAPLDSTNAQPAAAASAVDGAMIVMYQSSISDMYLYYRTWNVALNQWSGPTTIYNPMTGDKCKTLYGPTAAFLDGKFYCVYIDGTKGSASYGNLVYILSPDGGLHWSPPQPLPTITKPLLNPGLTAYRGQLWCAFADLGGVLLTMTGTPSASGVSWEAPVQVGQPPSWTQTAPGLGVFEDCLYCVYTHGSNDNGALHFRVRQEDLWLDEEIRADSQTPSGAALAEWAVDSERIFVCLYRSYGSETNLKYITKSGSTPWSMEFREASNKSSNGPAMVSYGEMLFAFYRGGDRDTIYWDHTITPGIDRGRP